MIEMKPCPFCGKRPYAYVCKREGAMQDGLWLWANTHKDDCILWQDDFFGRYNFGKAEDENTPTESLLRYIEMWNRRAEDV